MEERLQKIISRAGIASRRHAEQLILSGAVTVNGRVITALGTKADPARDRITVGPRVVRAPRDVPSLYFAFHKPPQVVSTMNDPEGRPCLGPYLRNTRGRLFPVGRLEFDAAGLLLLTSDGELASDLMRAAATIPQVWRFKIKGRIPEEMRRQLEQEARAQLRLYRDAANAWYEAELRDAPRDLLRQLLFRRGFLVEKAVRAGFGGIELGSLAPGEMRELTPQELSIVRRAARGRTGSSEGQGSIMAAAPRREHAAGREGIARAVTEWRKSRSQRTPRRDGHATQASRPAGRAGRSSDHQGLGGRQAAGGRRGRQKKRHP